MKEIPLRARFTARQNVVRERLINEARAPGVYRSSPLLSSSGQQIEVYHDFDLLVTDPLNSKDAVELFSDEIRRIRIDFEPDLSLLGFIDKKANTTGAIALAGAISIETGIPYVPIRLWKDLPSERVKLPSTDIGRPVSQKLLGEKLALITDHSTTGTELLDAVDAVDSLGGTVTDVISYTLNEALFAEEDFRSRGIRVHYFAALPRSFQERSIERVKIHA
jgi:orotate phosphoribosyltransferase